jgi:hypothetical protein
MKWMNVLLLHYRIRIGDDPMEMEMEMEMRMDSTPNALQKPIILSSLSKTTIIRRKEEFPNENGTGDLVIFACHDCYIYVLAPVRYPFFFFF